MLLNICFLFNTQYKYKVPKYKKFQQIANILQIFLIWLSQLFFCLLLLVLLQRRQCQQNTHQSAQQYTSLFTQNMTSFVKFVEKYQPFQKKFELIQKRHFHLKYSWNGKHNLVNLSSNLSKLSLVYR